MNRAQLRQTGRSSRLLAKAIEVANTGRYVVVVADNQTHARMLQMQCSQISGGEIRDTKVMTKRGSITFETPETVRIDWQRVRLLNAHPSCVLLIDHHAIEDRFHALWDMMHAFDRDCSSQ